MCVGGGGGRGGGVGVFVGACERACVRVSSCLILSQHSQHRIYDAVNAEYMV